MSFWLRVHFVDRSEMAVDIELEDEEHGNELCMAAAAGGGIFGVSYSGRYVGIPEKTIDWVEVMKTDADRTTTLPGENG